MNNNQSLPSNPKYPLLTEDEVYNILKEQPPIPLETTVLQGSIVNVDEYIKKYNVKEVTSYYIYEPGTTSFHPEGLFSEVIFGKLISIERFQKLGYINLNTDIIQPIIYFILSKLKSLYIKILEGKAYAIFNTKTHDFELSDINDTNSNTGYNFFISHIYDLKPPKVESSTKQGYREVFLKYQSKNLLLTNKLLVMPAGLREITLDTKKLTRDSINQMYLNVLSLSRSIDPKVHTDPVYDNIKVMIQNKVMDIWSYITNTISGDKGFIQDKFGDRNVAFGTGNVLSTDIKSSYHPDDITNLQPNDVAASLTQLSKGYQPFLIYYLKQFFKQFINPSSNIANVIQKSDKDIFSIVTINVPNKIVKQYNDEVMLESIINSLRYDVFKSSDVSIKIKDDIYYFFLLYDIDKIIIGFRDINVLRSFLESKNMMLDTSKIRPPTWTELIYILLYPIVELGVTGHTNYGFTTRYPTDRPGSIRPFRPKIYTTIPSRVIIYYNLILDYKNAEQSKIIYPRYPILGEKYFEAMSINSLVMKQSSSDCDGDILYISPLYSKEANDEIDLYYNTTNSVLSEFGGFQYDLEDAQEEVIRVLGQ